MSKFDNLDVILADFATRMGSLFGDSLGSVVLFGSCARGDMNEESDVDILVLLNLPESEIRSLRRTVSDVSSELDLEYGVVLSPVLQSYEEFEKYASASPFFANIRREGIKVA